MSNNRYNTPEEGRTDWHVPLNENFENLDTDVEIRDTSANRSDYSPSDGTKFLAIDTGEVFIGDGDQWTKIGRFAQRRIFVQDTEPKNGAEGDVWIRPQ